jgi:hypothetical protein
MQDLSDDDRKQILGEVLFDELRAIREGLDDVPRRAEFNDLKAKVDEIGADIGTLKLVATDTSRQINDHENRISAFETA